ncbi:MAG: M15 family metallopeptidase [Lachnospiraceae bacterium]|nr:M15 family metallopeptidase [Lachnospiraceae bacterium]
MARLKCYRIEALEKTYEQTMPAGKSEHETGLALDLLCSENVNMDISQADEPGNRWLAEHAHEYGFILRYPKDKEDITDIYYEPWHFRYVGKETAAFLYEQEWTLEEFWECLETWRHGSLN